jgi:hypothetical protein
MDALTSHVLLAQKPTGGIIDWDKDWWHFECLEKVMHMSDPDQLGRLSSCHEGAPNTGECCYMCGEPIP